MYHHLSFTKSSTSKLHWDGCWDSFHLILEWKVSPSVLPSSSPSDLCLKVVDIPHDLPDWFSMSTWTPGSPDEALFLGVGVSSAMKLAFASVESTHGPSECGWLSSSPLNRTRQQEEGWRKGPPSFLPWGLSRGIAVHLLLPGKGFTPLALWVLRLWTQTEPHP